MSQHKIAATRSGSYNGMDYDNDYTITFNYVPGSPDVRYLNNGDPGYPGWAAEVEFVSVEPLPDAGAFTDLAVKDVEEWASDWLDEHYDECVESAEHDMQPDPDAAYDARRDDGDW